MAWYRRFVPKGTVYQRGKTWWYAGPNPNGPRSVSLGTQLKTEAGPLAKAEYERRAATRPQGEMEKLVSDFAADEGDGRSKVYTKAKVDSVKGLIAHGNISAPEQITQDAISAYLKSTGESPKSLRNRRGHLMRFCEWLITKNQLSNNPAARIPPAEMPDKRINYLNREELELALDIAVRLEIVPVLVAAYSGLRIGEIKALRRDDVLLGKTATFRVMAKPNKGGEKPAPMHPKLVEIIRRHMAKNEHPELLFAPQKPIWWYRILRPIQEQIPKVNGYHVFRHTIASLLLQEGQRIEDVSRVLRHSEIRTTEKYYAQFNVEHGGREALSKL
jgi:integrase